MILSTDRANIVFRKVKQIQDEIKAYCLASDRPDIPVEEFQAAVSRMYNIAIEKRQVPFEGEFLRGMMERYQDKVIIYIKKTLSDDWKRFVAVKELCHVVNDEEEDWSVNGTTTIRALLDEYGICNDKIAEDIVQSEIFAEIAAIELLYPYKARLADLEAMNGGGLSTTKIAGYHKIPEKMVVQALSESYHETARSLWNSID